MSEEMLCKLGREPKTLSYIDAKNEKYIQIICKLKDSVNDIKLKKFFDTMYQIKLDPGYSDALKIEYSTGDLINCFKSILIEKKVINLCKICKILNKEYCEFSNPVSNAIQEFFNMFEVIDFHPYSLNEYNCMIRVNHMNPLFRQQNSNFSTEEQAIGYNTTLVELQNYQEDSLEKQSLPKIKVRVKNTKKCNQFQVS